MTLTRRIYLSIVGLTVTTAAHASSLEALQAALAQLQNNTPVSVHFETQFEETRDEDDPKRFGHAQIYVRDDINGLAVRYDKETLTKIEQERKLRIENEEANTPTLSAIYRLEAPEIQASLLAAPGIERTLKRAKYTGSKSVNFNGELLTSLHFELPVEAVISDKKTRKYVSKFSSSYQVLVRDDGTPVETRSEFSGKGRAYLVISVEAYGQTTERFAVHDGRLISVLSEEQFGYKSTFGDGLTKNKNIVHIQQTEVANNDIAK